MASKNEARKALLVEKVTDFSIDADSKKFVDKLWDMGGFSAKKVSEGAKILRDMISDESSTNILSFPADIMATGLRGIIVEAAKRKWFDLMISTCGTLDHDIARAFGNYYHGAFEMDDTMLHKLDIHRLGNVLVPVESYGLMIEEKMAKFLNELNADGITDITTHEFNWKLGKFVNKDNSLLYWTYKNNIPLIIPGITDGSVGYQLWQFYQEHKKFRINLLGDEQLMSDTIWDAKKAGALCIGGGISKHHAIWWAQFRGGFDYTVYITTAQEYDGSLSGARTREAISWGKIKEKARHVNIDGDATLILPIIASSLSDIR
jgi:deoxyhypusine synthase